jgi:CheY-like chemotaxis protein
VLGKAREGAERVGLIVGYLRAFAEPCEAPLRPVDVRSVLESAITMAWNEIRHHATLVRDYADTPLVRTNLARLGQVFLNLLLNAAQAIPAGRADQERIEVSTRLGESGSVLIEVRDSGSGIPLEIQDRIFDPFFTTKSRGVGRGLGLFVSQGIMAEIGGRIDVESTPGKGSTFRVSLPAATHEEIAAPSRAMEGPTAQLGSEPRKRILVLDDEESVGEVIQLALEDTHDVVPLSSGEAALNLIAAGERFDVILCDLMMPVISGIDFFTELLRIAPELAAHVIFITGGAFTPEAQAFLEHVPNPCLQKPFDPDRLNATINEHLQHLREAQSHSASSSAQANQLNVR